MKFLKTHWYWLLVIVIGLGIGSIITVHRVQQETSEPKQEMPEVAERPTGAARPLMHTTPDSTGRKTPGLIRPNIAARINSVVKTPVPIHVGHDHPEPTPPMPTLHRLDTDPKLRELAAAGKLWDMQNTGPTLTQEASQRELEVLTDGMNPEEAIAFLEEHRYYNEAILDQVSAHRAFKFLLAIGLSKEADKYAKKALAENPDDFEAKMELMLSEQDDAKAAAGYREILAKDPNHVGALLNLAYRTHYDDPEGALEHLIKANKLDPTRGVGDIGMVYERLGDIKTAWIYYRKHLTFWPRDGLVRSHMREIETGQPKYLPIHFEHQTVLPREEAVLNEGAVIPKEQRTPAAAEVPGFLDRPPRETDPQEDLPADAAAAQAEYERWQAAAQKEFDEFIKWAERIMHEDSVRDTDDFLAQELRAHLKGGKAGVSPERLVRAFELMERHGRTDGLLRLKDKDPDLAAEVERFLKEKRHPSRRNNQQDKNE